MNMDKKLSIIISFSGKKRLFKKVFDRILSLLHKEDELILVNDYKDDDILDIIGEHIINSNIRVIEHNLDKRDNNMVYCRNIGASSAKSSYLIFLDEDMYVHENLFNHYKKFLPTYKCICGRIVWEKNSIMLPDYRISGMNHLFLYTSIIKAPFLANYGVGGGGNFGIIRNLFEQVGMFSEEFNGAWGHEDIDLFRKIISSGKEIYYSYDAVAIHLQHKRNLSGCNRNYRILKQRWGY